MQLDWNTKWLSLSTMNDNWYSFNVYNDGLQTLTKVSIKGNWLNVEKWWLNVTWNTTLNNDLTIKGDLYVKSIMGTPPTQQIKTLLSLKTWDMTIDVNTTVKQKLDVEKNLNVEKNTTLKSWVVVKTLLSGQSYPTDALSISNNSDWSKAKMNFTGDAEINDGILKITSKEVNTPWDIRTMSQITLTPSNSSSYNKFWDNFHENFSVTDLAPCNPGREWTITYYRKIDDDWIYSYWYFKGCVCSYKYNSKTSNNISSFSCHWLNLNQKLYQENGVWNTISDID